MGARITGKIKAVVQGSVIIAVALLDVLQATSWPDLPSSEWAWTGMAVVAGVTTLSLFDYVLGSASLLRVAFRET